MKIQRDRKAYQREYYAKNREKILARTTRTPQDAHDMYIKHRDNRLEYMRRYYEKHTTKIKDTVKKYREKNSGKIKILGDAYYKRCKQDPEYFRKFHLKKTYGLTLEAWRHLLKAQKSRCAICQRKLDTATRDACIDHDHTTGIIRGILCRKCNIGLGHFDDSLKFLQAAINYLKKENTPMPIHRSTKNGKPAYQWGDSGAKYTYTAGDAGSRERAKKKAIAQGLAVANRTRTKPEL